MMTGLGVERTPRTAYRLPSVPPTGVRPSLPPHIQGAERRTESRTRHTGVRWSLRVLVVGGLAGAAWLLTGAAAHAADRSDGPVGSLLGSVVGGDTTTPVTGLLKAATQPLEASRPAHHRHHVVADIIDVPRRVLTRPVETVDEVTHSTSGTPVDAAIGGVDQLLREVAGPIRLTGGPADPQRLTTVTDTVTAIPIQAGERPQEPAVAPVRKPAFAPVEVPAVAPVRVVEHPAALTVASRTTNTRSFHAPADAPRVTVPAHHGKAHSASSAHRTATAPAVIAEPETASEDTPGGDGPAAPLRLHVGDVSGTPTSGSGAPTEGGSAAFLPAAIASSTTAYRLLPIASDVEVRRFDAEAPTVSPD
jgi:hypothetical protein